MSLLKTKMALSGMLTAGAIVPNDDISFQDAPELFDPANKSLWVAEYTIPATEESMGKTYASSNEERGIYQISVFTPKDIGDYGVSQLTTIDSVKALFYYNSSNVYNGQTVSILESTVGDEIEVESWLKRDISINYLTFSTR